MKSLRHPHSPHPVAIDELRPLSFIFEVRDGLPREVCREMIRRFETRTEQQYQGLVGQRQWQERSIKKSTDVTISGKADWKDIDAMLFASMARAIGAFRHRYPYFQGRFKDMGYVMQRTLPGEYYHWHIDGGSHEFSQRQLVAIWYLNDVESPGGETEFLYQDVKVKPSEGKLLLFPPFWTHQHRGVTLEKGVKYIATTWVVFA
ncbi:MAG: 2OG-Fe(II) oxygenase [Gammaproteobacteria bacterium]